MAETVPQYEVAAGERLYDALELALSDGRSQSTGGVYFFGYVIEMVLKAAYFRVVDWPLTQPVQLKTLSRSVAKTKFNTGDGHNLVLLLQALLAERGARDLGLPPALASDLAIRTTRAAAAWSVDLRYDGSSLPTSVINQMYDDASWFFSHRLALTQ